MKIDPGDSDGHSMFRFESFSFDPRTLELRCGVQVVELEPNPARVLGTLLKAGGRVVTREEIGEAVWPGRFLDRDQSINYAIRRIREALGDDASHPRFVRTAPRVGYAMMGEVRLVPMDGIVPPHSDPGGRSATGWRAGAVLGVVAIVILFVLAVRRPQPPESASTWLASGRLDPSLAGPDVRRRYELVRRWVAVPGVRPAAEISAVLDTILVLQPAFLPAILMRAELQIWSDSFPEAIRVLDSLLPLYPEVPEIHTLVGAARLFRVGDSASALVELDRGAQLGSGLARSQHYAAYGALIRGDASTATRRLLLALRLDPVEPTLAADAGMLFRLLGMNDEWVDACELAERLSPGGDRVQECLLLAAFARGDSGSARRWMARLLPAEAGGTDGDSTVTLRVGLRRLAAMSDTTRLPGLLARWRWLMIVGDTSTVRAEVADRIRGRIPMVETFSRLDPLLRPMVP